MSLSISNTAPVRTTTYAWYLAGLLALAYLLNIVDRFLLALLLEHIKSSLQLTDTQIGFLQGPSFVALFVVASLPMGWLADIWNRRALITLGVLIWSLATLACGLAGTFRELFAARLMVGLGEATLMPCAMSLIVASFSRDKLNRGISIYSMGGSLGRFVAFSGGGALLAWLLVAGGLNLPVVGHLTPWQSLFVIAGLLGIVVAIILWMSIREPVRVVAPALSVTEIAEALCYFGRNIWAYLAIIIPFSMITAITMQLANWTVSFYARKHQLTASDAGQIVGFTGLAFGPAGHLLGGWLNDLLTKRGVKGSQPLVLLAILVVVPFLIAVFLRADSIPLAVVAYGFSYLGLCVAGPTGFGGVQRLTPDRMRGFISSLFLMVYMTLGSGLGPMAAGLIGNYYFKDEGMLGQSILAGTIIFTVVGLPFAFFGRRAYARAVAQNESQNI
jgi:MFS family permease